MEYSTLKVSEQEARQIAEDFYGIHGKVRSLPGEIDFNFKLSDGKENYILKISRPGYNVEYLEFQISLLQFLEQKAECQIPKVVLNSHGATDAIYVDAQGQKRNIRLLSWIDGRPWSDVSPRTIPLYYSLGLAAGTITKTLKSFDHPGAHRTFEWDLAQAEWTKAYRHLFQDEELVLLDHFREKYEKLEVYSSLRKSVIHNDVNDNNILVSVDDLIPDIVAIIDYGDAVYTHTINDLAVVIAYALTDADDPLQCASNVVRGYHESFPLEEDELSCLYSLIGMRMVISATKSAINKKEEPENEYLQISDQAAWSVLRRWSQIPEKLAYYFFRKACGLIPHPKEDEFRTWCKLKRCRISELFPKSGKSSVQSLDMSVGSSWLGHAEEFNDFDLVKYKLSKLDNVRPEAVPSGGYLEVRPFYSTDAYHTGLGKSRTTHLGVDFWLPAETPVHAILPGTVFCVHDNCHEGDYGPTLILSHEVEGRILFFTLYGHLSRSSLTLLKIGQQVEKGDLIGYLGNEQENGSWVPHLHFQLILDMLENTHDFPGVMYPDEIEVWKSICPNPNLLFKEEALAHIHQKEDHYLRNYRNQHLGKSLSLSYDRPLHIIRGADVFLINEIGQRFLDTVNNVAHVGHENYRVVKAGQQQMSLLNTNTRYLHPLINKLTEKLISKCPASLSVVHYVNSGSEANELALRMAEAFSGTRNVLAVEVGYHGNTSRCIDVSSYKFEGPGGNGSSEQTFILPLPDTFRGKFHGSGADQWYVQDALDTIDRLNDHKTKIGAFLCESILSCGGQMVLPQNYLRNIYQKIRENGGLCIADEVQVGLGRVGSHFWGFELYGVEPDIITVGKPFGNGHPVAAVICTPEVAGAFNNGMEYFNTFGGNPVSCAIACEVLQTIEDQDLQQNAWIVGKYFKEQLQSLQTDYPIIGDVRGVGLFLGFELNDKNRNPLSDRASYLSNRMREYNILTSTDGRDHNVIKIKPPMTFSKKHVDIYIKTLAKILKENYLQLDK